MVSLMLEEGAEQIDAAAQQAGFSVREMLTFNRAGTLGWWLNGKVLERKTFSLWQIKLLNLSTPLLRLVDRWLPLPALSLIAILEKAQGAPQSKR